MKVGGQAIMEGVLMRSPNFWGMAVRAPSGEMDLRAERFRSVTRRSKLFRLPIIRGALSLGETLWLGMKALTLSTNVALGEEQELSKKEIAGTLVFALVLGFGLFLVAPVLGTKGLGSLVGGSIENPILFNLVEGVIRIAIFVIPIVAGLAFEFIMWSARHQDSALVRVLVWPGLQMQKLTTREPSDDMVEVAMASLKKVLTMEKESELEPNEATNKLVI